MPDSGVFSNRMIIVPNQEIQKWVKLKLAEDLKIAANLRFCFLKQALSELLSLFFDLKQPIFFQNTLELTLKIEKALKELIAKDPLFEPLFRYVQNKESRLLSLSKHLAPLFQKYGIYGKKACEKWEKNPTEWREKLWQKVYENGEYPLKIFPNLSFKKKIPEDFSIHIFGLNHISPLYFNFFLTLSSKVPLFFYHLSFCQEFWSDLPLKSQVKENEEIYLENSPLLLSNFGSVSRQMAKLFEEEESLIVYETYIPSEKETSLSQLQKGLLFFQKEELKEDDSIQIHVSTSRHREIQNLKNTLLFLMKEKNLEPKDIQVLAPDITEYAPFIRHYFECAHISDLPLFQKNSQMKALFLLLDLDRKRWSAPYLLQIMEHPLFLEKWGWQKEDLSLIRSWVQKTGVRWGYDVENKNRNLEQNFCEKKVDEKKATWKEGLDILFYELAVKENLKLDFSSSEILGELAHFLDKLNRDLLKKREKKSLKDWTRFLKELMATYFAETDERKQLFELLDTFAKASLELYSFEIAETLLRDWLQKETWTENPNQVQVIHFSSIGPMKALPCKVICLLGLNDSFPKKEGSSSFDLLKKGGDFCPSSKELDQNFFLEACVSAKENLILSYLSDEPPSSCASTLLQLFESKTLIVHPARSFDSKYFDGKNPELKNGSKLDLALAQKFYKTDAAASSFFIRKRDEGLPQGTFQIEIKDLLRSLRSPLKHFLTHAYRCKLKEEEDLKDEEEFTLSPLNFYQLKKSFFKKISHENIPPGFFGKLACSQIEEEKIQLNENLRGYHLQDVILAEGKKTADGILYVSPLHVKVNDELSVHIRGKIENVFSQGLLSLDKGNFQNSAKIWPLFVIASSIEDWPEGFEMKELFFAKDQVKKKRFFTEPQEFLKRLLEFYFFSQKNPFFLAPSLVEAILKEDISKFERRLRENFDPSIEWALKGRALDFEKIVNENHFFSQRIYKEMADAWF